MYYLNSEIWSHLPGRDVLKHLAEFAAREKIQLHLVGGTVRDLLLGKDIEDVDFAVSDSAFSFARKFAGFAKASFVPLDEEHDTARVVFNRGELYMDFSGIRGEDIISDLMARDIAINAMAVELNQAINCDTSTEVTVIDPCSGMADLSNGLIRLASAHSISDDPIRMLRAYRFAATLDFTIHRETATIIQDSVSLLDTVSVERIRDELFKILSAHNSVAYLKEMDDVGLLEQIFPEIARMKWMEQGDYHHLDAWEHSMLTLEFFEQDPLPDSLEENSFEDYLNDEPVKGRARRSLLKLAALLHDVGKPVTRTVGKDGRIRFFDHNLQGSEIITDIGKRLKLATRETLFLRSLTEYHMYPLGLIVSLQRSKSVKKRKAALRRFIYRTGPDGLAILLLSYADLRATQGPRRKADDLRKLAQLAGEITSIYLHESRFPMPKLVTGKDLIAEFDLTASPAIGKILKQVQKAQINGTVNTRNDAMKLVKGILRHRHP